MGAGGRRRSRSRSRSPARRRSRSPGRSHDEKRGRRGPSPTAGRVDSSRRDHHHDHGRDRNGHASSDRDRRRHEAPAPAERPRVKAEPYDDDARPGPSDRHMRPHGHAAEGRDGPERGHGHARDHDDAHKPGPGRSSPMHHVKRKRDHHPPAPAPSRDDEGRDRGRGPGGGGEGRGGGGGGGRGREGGGRGRGGGGRDGGGRGGGGGKMSDMYMSREEREELERKAEEDAKPKAPKEQPNLGLSGKLAAETNKVAGGVVLKHVPPGDARKPDRRWRLYVFKNEKLQEEPFHIHRMDHYLFGRDMKIADIISAHPSCSKQHAVLQFRFTDKGPGSGGAAVRPYLLDLEAINGTFLNGERIEPLRYYELLEKDVVRLGQSSREYVLLHDNSQGD